VKIGRNDSCTCGSGVKYKKCCLLKDEIYDFNVTYLQSKKFKCQIRLSGDNDLQDLHNKIQNAYGWDNDHMFSFFMNNKIWDRSSEFSGNPMGEGSANRLLKNLNLKSGHKFLYVFDYGDEHCFQIDVLSISRQISEGIPLGVIATKGTPPQQYAAHW
jgi:hypothetical protein